MPLNCGMYLDPATPDSDARSTAIQQAFPGHMDWTDQNFWIIFAGQEVETEDGEILSWNKDMIQVCVPIT